MSLVFAAVALATGLLLAAVPAPAQTGIPERTGRVVDAAGLLSMSLKQDLTDQLRQHENATGNQVVVVTVSTLSGESIETFGRNLANHWGLGRRNKDRAVLLIVAPSERRVRIEVARGLESVLTNATARDIIDRQILPSFHDRNYESSIQRGAMGILLALEGQSVRPEVSSDWMGSAVVILVVALLLGVLGAFVYSLDSTKDKRNSDGNGEGDTADFYEDGYSDGGGGSFNGGGASGGDSG